MSILAHKEKKPFSFKVVADKENADMIYHATYRNETTIKVEWTENDVLCDTFYAPKEVDLFLAQGYWELIQTCNP